MLEGIDKPDWPAHPAARRRGARHRRSRGTDAGAARGQGLPRRRGAGGVGDAPPDGPAHAVRLTRDGALTGPRQTGSRVIPGSPGSSRDRRVVTGTSRKGAFVRPDVDKGFRRTREAAWMWNGCVAGGGMRVVGVGSRYPAQGAVPAGHPGDFSRRLRRPPQRLRVVDGLVQGAAVRRHRPHPLCVEHATMAYYFPGPAGTCSSAAPDVRCPPKRSTRRTCGRRSGATTRRGALDPRVPVPAVANPRAPGRRSPATSATAAWSSRSPAGPRRSTSPA